ncbi:MAG: type IV pilin protein [Bacteroidia bacterium]|nr:type IV pilin protein [Bacteroidia bacterium]
MKIKLTFSGMTLTELLVVLAILGILLLLAFPVLKPIISRTYAMEARTNLRHLAELQEDHYMTHLQYSTEFPAIGFEQATLATETNGNAHYRLEIVKADRENFTARATAVTDFDRDGLLNVWEIDKSGNPRELIPD